MSAAPYRSTLALFVTVAATLATGCAGTTELVPAPDLQASALSCVDAYPIGSPIDRPTRLEVWNETGKDLRITLDQCGHTAHLGWVASGNRVSFRLPPELVQFPDGLRLHAWDVAADASFGTYGVQPNALVPRLIIKA